MDNKYFLLIGIVVIILCIGGVYLYTNSSNNTDGNQFTVGSATFTLPDGYNVTETKNENNVKISNGFNTVTVACYDNKNITKYVDDYVSLKEGNNYHVNISNYTLGNHTVFKSELDNDTSNVHYWFKHGGKTYTIFSSDANKHMNKLANQLIGSIKTDK